MPATSIMFVAVYDIPENSWYLYSTKNSTGFEESESNEEPSMKGTTLGPAEIPFEDIFGTPVEPFMEINPTGSGYFVGPENIWTRFQLKYNTSTTVGVYAYHAAALDSNMQAYVYSRDDEFDIRAVGMTFDEAVDIATGGQYTWDRYDDDGNPVYSATRGVDFNMTASISGSDLDNVTVFIDLPNQVQGQELIDGPFPVTTTEYGGWQYDPIAKTYVWNASLEIEHTEMRFGLHWETTQTWYENGVEFEYDEPYWDGDSWEWQTATGWAWAQEAIVYWFGNETFGYLLVYTTYLPTEFIEDPSSDEGGYWEWNEVSVFYDFPTDGSVPQPYHLNTSTSSYNNVNGEHVVTFRGHIGEDMLPTGGMNSYPLQVREKVFAYNGKQLVPSAYLPIASQTEQQYYQSLQSLAIETPISVVRLLHKGEPYDPSWLFLVDQEETFTVKARLQGGAEYADDIDGVALVLRAWENDWGYNETTSSHWSQWSEIEIWMRVNPQGQTDITVYNRTERESWEFGYSWVWVETYPGVWEQQYIEDYYWSHKVWSFETNSWVDFVPYRSNATVMNVDYVELGNFTYELIGNDLRTIFDVTVDSTMPDMEWQWDYYYGNLTLVPDYESGWGEQTHVGWVKEPVYSYMNMTSTNPKIYAETPHRGVTMRDNDTEVLYPAETFPFIFLDGKEYDVKKIYEYDFYGGVTERVVFEEWNSSAYDPMTGGYTGNWEYYYRLAKNDSRIYIKTGAKANIYNVSLLGGAWFEAYRDYSSPIWWRSDLAGYDYVVAINGTPIIGLHSGFWDSANFTLLGTRGGIEVGKQIYANETIPVYLQYEPIWDFDHYILVLNGTGQELHVWEEYYAETDDYFYVYHNTTSGEDYWFFNGVWPQKTFRIFWDGKNYLVGEKYTKFLAYTTINGNNMQLPTPGATDIYSIWDLNTKTPKRIRVEIDGALHPAIKSGIYHNTEGNYDYQFYTATVNTVTYNLTLYSYDEWEPWNPDPYNTYVWPWVTKANNSIRIPELTHHDWTVAHGHRDPQTWEFVVEGYFDLVSGYYDGNPSNSRIWDDDLGYEYVNTSTGQLLNYSQFERLFLYRVEFPNGTWFYAPHPWVEDVAVDMGDYYEVMYYYMYNITGDMVTWTNWQELNITLAIPSNIIVDPDPYNNTITDFEMDHSDWYPVFEFNYTYWDIEMQQWYWYYEWNVERDWFWGLQNSTGHRFEVVPLDQDPEFRYNFPSFNFTYGATEYNLTGAPEMIYKQFTFWGYSKKLDYVPLPVTIMKEQWSLIVGAPKWGMWGLQSWTTNPSNGAIDLDSNLQTTGDQFFVRSSFNSTDLYNITQEYMDVSILWEPNATIFGDEFIIESNMGMQTVNWTSMWEDNYYWYNAETGELVSPAEWAMINATVFDDEGRPNPGYWDMAWMAENFTSADLKAIAEEEGWDWAVEDSQEWSWVWWEMYQHYGTEIVNDTETEYVSVDVWYEYAGMFAWNDTDSNDVMDYNTPTDSEATHYWLPREIGDINFTTPDGSPSGDVNFTVNDSIPFGVTFTDVNGTVFPFGDYSYFDWFSGQYYGSNLATFDERPTSASTQEFSIGAIFSGNITNSGNNVGEVKFNMTVGNWDVNAPGGRNLLAGRSLGIAFYSHIAMRDDAGQPLVTQYLDDLGQPLGGNQTTSSSTYNISMGLGNVASMNLGGSPYTWAKVASANYTVVDSQTVPFGAFQAAYTSQAGGSATSFTVIAAHFYTLINFKWWDGYAVTVDPVFVSYSSKSGSNDEINPSVDSVSTNVRYIDNNERLYFEVAASDAGSGVAEVRVMDQSDSFNTTLTYNGDIGKYVGYVEMKGTNPYTFEYDVIALDYAFNENGTGVNSHTFYNDQDKPSITNIGVSQSDPLQSSITISANVEDIGVSDIDYVEVYLINSESTVPMTYDSGSGKYEASIPRSSGWVYTLAYRIRAYDNAGNMKRTSELSYQFKDIEAPSLTDVTATKTETDGNETAFIRATVTEVGGSTVSSVQLTYTIAGSQTVVAMQKETGTSRYNYTIPNQNPGTWVYYTITATDSEGNSFTTSEATYQFSTEGDSAPGMGAPTAYPTSPTSSDTVTINVTVNDDFGIKNVTLYYKVDSGSWNEVAMTADGSTYSADIPAQADGSVVTYYMVAYDSIDQMTQSDEYTYTVSDGDQTAPQITSVSIDIAQPTSSDSVVVTAVVSDNVAIDNVTLYYKVDSGSYVSVSMSGSSGTYTGTIPAQADGSVVTYYIRAYDTSGNYVDSTESSYTVEDEESTTTETTDTSTETTDTGPTSPEIPFETMTMLILAGGAAVVLVIIAVMVKRRR